MRRDSTETLKPSQVPSRCSLHIMRPSGLTDTLLQHKISIIIPVFNEESKITDVLNNIRGILMRDFQNYEIIIIDDGSGDSTLKIILEAQKLDSRIKVLSHVKNQGKGFAVRLGVLNSTGEIVLFLDGDLDINPMEIVEYVDQLDGCDLVIASKAHPLSVVIAPTGRKFVSKIFNLLVRLLLGIKIKDTQSGLKVGRGSVLRPIFGSMVVKRYAFDVELLAIASRLDLKIKELPIFISLNGWVNIREVIKMFLDILQISYRIKIGQNYQNVVIF